MIEREQNTGAVKDEDGSMKTADGPGSASAQKGWKGGLAGGMSRLRRKDADGERPLGTPPGVPSPGATPSKHPRRLIAAAAAVATIVFMAVQGDWVGQSETERKEDKADKAAAAKGASLLALDHAPAASAAAAASSAASAAQASTPDQAASGPATGMTAGTTAGPLSETASAAPSASSAGAANGEKGPSDPANAGTGADPTAPKSAGVTKSVVDDGAAASSFNGVMNEAHYPGTGYSINELAAGWRRDRDKSFTLRVQSASDAGVMFVVRIDRRSDGSPIVAAYLKGTETVDVPVPPGDYRVLVAYARQWSGTASMFSPSGQWYQAPGGFSASAGKAGILSVAPVSEVPLR